MADLRIGGRCDKHHLPKPCAECMAARHVQHRDLDQQDVLRVLHVFIGDGTQKAAADRLGVSQQYLSDVLNESREPGPLILAGLGLERIVSYRRKNSSAADGVGAAVGAADEAHNGGER